MAAAAGGGGGDGAAAAAEAAVWGEIEASAASRRTTNPIRAIIDQLKVPKDGKELIALSIGDPTVFGNLQAPAVLGAAVAEAATARTANGYGHSCGLPATRAAIAARYGVPGAAELTADDVIVASSCSGALELCVGALANEGDNLLVPAPGFSLYTTLCEYKGVEARQYPLLAEKGWEADLAALEKLIDAKTKAIIVNNPSNPCGSVYSEEHLRAIIAVAEKHHLPIVADEIYEGVVFKGHQFHRLASLTEEVPVLTVGGLAKLYLVPGWRVGWVLIHDRKERFKGVRAGLVALSTVILGANTLVQSAIPKLLTDTPQEYYDDLVDKLQTNAEILSKELEKVPQLTVVKPGGAMYLMIGINPDRHDESISTDVDFAKLLLAEESVFVLPGTIFSCPNFVRLVICPPPAKLQEACTRITEFCARHAKKE